MRLYLIVSLFLLSVIANAQQLVMRGDHPDPSVTKIGKEYWATATTSNWFPAYPLMRSTDLIHWKQQGYVFDTMPSWADYYFWAPEISYENGRVYVYYAAHKKNGNLCIAVASADKPEGPYRDHGPLICQVDGSIDAFPVRDESGKLFLVWKEDGNSIKQPTPIFAQQINEERTAMIGEKVELFRNNLPWEANLVEGVSMIQHDGYYYAFYAAAGCCGAGCTYKTGIARSRKLFGPWEKYEKNPLLGDDHDWRCKGHGTPIEKNGKYYFLYHAYRQNQGVYTGREGLLQPFHFTADGWIEFDSSALPDKLNEEVRFTDEFKLPKLKQEWQWSVAKMPGLKIVNDCLRLDAYPSLGGMALGMKTLSENYSATIDLKRDQTNAGTGISVIGDDENIVSLMLENDSIFVSVVKDSTEQKLFSRQAPSGAIRLGVRVKNGYELIFYYDSGSSRVQVNPAPVDASYLPPWDRALRIGISSRGNGVSVIDRFNAIFMAAD